MADKQNVNAVKREYRGAHLVDGSPFFNPPFWVHSGKGRRSCMGFPVDSKGRVMGRISGMFYTPEEAWADAAKQLKAREA